MGKFEQDWYIDRPEELEFDFTTATTIAIANSMVAINQVDANWPLGYRGQLPLDEYLLAHRHNISRAHHQSAFELVGLYRDFEKACIQYCDDDYRNVLQRTIGVVDVRKASRWLDTYRSDSKYFPLIRMSFEANTTLSGLITYMGDPLSITDSIETVDEVVTSDDLRRQIRFIYSGLLFSACVDHLPYGEGYTQLHQARGSNFSDRAFRHAFDYRTLTEAMTMPSGEAEDFILRYASSRLASLDMLEYIHAEPGRVVRQPSTPRGQLSEYDVEIMNGLSDELFSPEEQQKTEALAQFDTELVERLKQAVQLIRKAVEGISDKQVLDYYRQQQQANPDNLEYASYLEVLEVLIDDGDEQANLPF